MAESWMQLIEALLERRLVRRRELEEVMTRLRPRRETVEKVLVESGLVTKSVLLALKGELHHLGTIDLASMRIDDEVAHLLPQSMAERYTAICVGREQDTLILAAAEPLDAISIDYLRIRSGFEIKVMLAYAGDLLEERRRIYQQKASTGQATLRPSSSIEKIPRAPSTLDTASETQARRVGLQDSTRPERIAPMDPREVPEASPAPPVRRVALGEARTPDAPHARETSPEKSAPREPARIPLPDSDCRLCKATLHLVEGLDEKLLLDRILEEMLLQVDAEAASLLLPEIDGRSLFFKAAAGLGNRDILNRIVPLDQDSVARQVLMLAQPSIVHDVSVDPHHEKVTDRIIHFTTRCLAAVPVLWRGEVLGVMEAVNKQHGRFETRDIDAMRVSAAQMASALASSHVEARLRELLVDSVDLVVELMEQYGTISRAHLVNVAQLATALGREAGLPDQDLEYLTYAGMLHDVGLAGAPSNDEQEHARRGALLLERVPLLRPIVPVVQYHHERWDASGPFGLRGEEIPLQARVLAVAEEWCEHRPWNGDAEADEFLRAFLTRFGIHFDPELHDAFLRALATTLQHREVSDPPPS